MLTEICAEIKNYFCAKGDRILGDFAIVNGAITPSFDIEDGQYYRIIGSIFNDGVHKYGDTEEELKDEPKFHGAIWKMRVPKDLEQLADEITEWQKKYGDVNSSNMSPYSSESFGGYSYSKAQGFAATGGGMLTSWQSIFATRLKPYRRINPL